MDQDRDELAIYVAGQSYTPPVRELALVARAYRQGAWLGTSSYNTNRLAHEGEPAQVTLADLFSPVSEDRGWNKAAMVELRGFEPLTPSMRTRPAPPAHRPKL